MLHPITVVPELLGWVCSVWTWIYTPTAQRSAVQSGVQCLQGELGAVLSQDVLFGVLSVQKGFIYMKFGFQIRPFHCILDIHHF